MLIIISVYFFTGSVFTRWGRTSCPANGTDLVYKGYFSDLLIQGSYVDILAWSHCFYVDLFITSSTKSTKCVV